MLSAEERYQLLEEASELSEQWDYVTLKAWGYNLSERELYSDPEIAYLYALALYRCGDYEASWQVLHKLEDSWRNRGKDRLHCRRLSLKGALHVEKGDLKEAETYFSDTLFIAAAKDYKPQIATAIMDLGVIRSIRCEWDEAIAAFERALVAYEQIGASYNLASAHHNLGMTYREVGNYPEANAHLESASAFFRQHASTLEIAFSTFEKALVMKCVGDLNLAESTIRRAIDSLAIPRPLRGEAEGLRALAIVLNEKGNLAAAQQHLEKAIGLAAATGAKMLEAEIHEELAVISLSLGDIRRADTHAKYSSHIYRIMGADLRAGRVSERCARISPTATNRA